LRAVIACMSERLVAANTTAVEIAQTRQQVALVGALLLRHEAAVRRQRSSSSEPGVSGGARCALAWIAKQQRAPSDQAPLDARRGEPQ
jgi:hypothetical protein